MRTETASSKQAFSRCPPKPASSVVNIDITSCCTLDKTAGVAKTGSGQISLPRQAREKTQKQYETSAVVFFEAHLQALQYRRCSVLVRRSARSALALLSVGLSLRKLLPGLLERQLISRAVLIRHSLLLWWLRLRLRLREHRVCHHHHYLPSRSSRSRRGNSSCRRRCRRLLRR